MTIYAEAPEITPPTAQSKRPSMWSLSNWPVRWKVLAIVAVPSLVAVLFAGMQIYSSAVRAADLHLAAERAAMVRPIENYLATLEAALVASDGGDAQTAHEAFHTSRERLQQQLADSDVAPDVRSAITAILDDGPQLVDGVQSNSLDLRERVVKYAPILLTAQAAIDGSVRVDDEQVRGAAEVLSRAVGARGDVVMQQLLVEQGGALEPADLRAALITLSGTDPTTFIKTDQVPGVTAQDVDTLRQQTVTRMEIITDPSAVLAGNEQLLSSLKATDGIVAKVIDKTTTPLIDAVKHQASAALAVPIRYLAIALGASIAGAILVYLVARSLILPLRRLRAAALRVAHRELPAEIERIQAGEGPRRIQPIPVFTTEEVGQVAHAIDELHGQTLGIAAEQARLQFQIGDMFETLSLRSRSLVDQQLALVHDLERNEVDPRRLDALFKLDHLASRMRRNATNLSVLAGSEVRHEQAAPVSVVELINAATSQVEDYRRVMTAEVPDSSLVGPVAGDVAHLLAELIDNALQYSPPDSPVQVSALHTSRWELIIEVSDAGHAMTDADLRIANTRLDSGGEVTPYTTRHMGLFVVSRLAARHGLAVWLRRSGTGELCGTTAAVWIPPDLIASAAGFSRRWPDDTVPQARINGEMGYASNGKPAAARHDDNGSYWQEPLALPRPRRVASERVDVPKEPAETNGARPATEPVPSNGRVRQPSSLIDYTDVIFQGMLSEWPTEAVALVPQSWESVWHSGWSPGKPGPTALDDDAETGLTARRPGDAPAPGAVSLSRLRNGAAHRKNDEITM